MWKGHSRIHVNFIGLLAHVRLLELDSIRMTSWSIVRFEEMDFMLGMLVQQLQWVISST